MAVSVRGSSVFLWNARTVKKIHMNLSREEMADHLNITRPSLSRELGKMQEEGILELDRRQILVKDQEKMELYL